MRQWAHEQARRLIPRRLRRPEPDDARARVATAAAWVEGRARGIPKDVGRALDELRKAIGGLRTELLENIDSDDRATLQRLAELDDFVRRSVVQLAIGGVRLHRASVMLIIGGVILTTWPEWIDAHIWRGPF